MKTLKFALSATLGLGLVAGAASINTAFAQEFPGKQAVRLVVPYPPGGGADIFGRILSEALAKELGQNVVVENKPGANGIIGTNAVARAEPDGYTVVLGNIGPNAINQAIYPDLPYHTVDSFAPVSLIGYTTHALAVHPDVPVKSVKELIDYARKSPGTLNYASSGLGGSPHLAAELFQLMTDTKMVHVPYKGASPGNSDLVAGQVQLTFNTLPPLLSFIEADKLRVLAVTSKTRSGLLPDVPTIDEAGVDGYDVRTWYGIFAPAGTPKPVVDKLNQAFVNILAKEDVQKSLISQGYEVASSTPEEFAEMVKADVEMWKKVVKEANVKVQ